MSILLKTIGARYNDYMMNLGRQRSRTVLLQQSDRTLQDMGVSRSLLEKGAAYWPWRETDQPVPASPEKLSRAAEARAIRELRGLSDYALRDIGISRGEIVDVVRNGRPGIDKKPVSSQVLEQLSKEPVSTASVDLDNTAANVAPDNSPDPTSPATTEKSEAA